jgi:hypothetical protein
MLLTITNRFLLLTTLGFAATLAHAQAYTPPPPRLVTGPCVPTKDYPCTPPPANPANTPPSTPNQFAFPGEPGDPKPAPASPASATPATTPADPFAFPGEPEDHPAARPAVPVNPKFPFPDEAESSSSSSSSSAPSEPSPEPTPEKPALADKGSSGSTRSQRRHLPKVEDLDHRESEDLEISRYYVTTGNFLAAYNRAKDAVNTIPDDPLAHFAVAEAAARLNKRDEAIAEYQAYLKLDPEGEKVKQSQRALATLTKP